MAKKSSVASGDIEKKLAMVKNAEKIRDDADKMFGYSRAVAEYNGKYEEAIPSFIPGADIIPINEVYAYVKTFIPSVYSRDPYITVNPKGRKYIVGCKLLELDVNAYWRELNLKRQIRKAIFDACFAQGIIKVGYTSSLGDITKEDGDKSIAPSQYIMKDEIFAQRVSWKNFVHDPDSTDGLYDARFCAHQIILPLEAVKSSSYYENTKNLRPNYSVTRTGISDLNKNKYEYDEELVVMWEVWDQDLEKVYTIAEGAEDYLMYKNWPYKFNGYPFEMLRFNETTDMAYGPNLIGPWEPQLWEKMKIRAMELDHIKRFGRQLTCEEGALSKLEEDKFKKGLTGSIIKYRKDKQAPVPIPYPPLQTDIYGVENRVDVDKDSVSGMPNTVRSAPQKTSSRTLGEVDRLIAAFQSRQNDPQAIVEEYSEEIAKKVISLMGQYFKKERFIKVSAQDNQWLQRELKDNPPEGNPSMASDMKQRMEPNGFWIKPEDFKKLDFEIEVRAGSTLPLDRKNRVSAMVSILDLGEKVGIIPGDKISEASKLPLIIGKNLVAEFEMPEVTAAYEDLLNTIEAKQTVAKVGQIANMELIKQKAQRLQERSKAINAQGQQSPPQPPPQGQTIPDELLT